MHLSLLGATEEKIYKEFKVFKEPMKRSKTPFILRCFTFLLAVACVAGGSLVRAAIEDKAPDKKEVLKQLKDLQDTQQKKLRQIDEEIAKRLNATRSVKLDNMVNAENLPEQLQKLHAQKREYSRRQDFVNRLIFEIDNSWNGQDLRGFLEAKLLDMAAIELKDDNGDSHLSSFFSYLSIALREMAEPRENMVAFIDGYMSFSSLSDPQSPQKFLAARNYTNGAVNETAHGVSRDDLGVVVEKKLRAAQIH